MALARPSKVVILSSDSDGEQLSQPLKPAKRRSGSHSSGYSRRRSHSIDLLSSAEVPEFSPFPDSGAPLLPSWRPYARARGGVSVQPNHADGQEALDLDIEVDIGLNEYVSTEFWTPSVQGGRKRRRRTEGTIKPAREEEVDMSDPHRLNGRGVQKDVVGGVWNTLGEDELRTCEEWLAEVDCPRKGGAEAERRRPACEHREGVPVGEGKGTGGYEGPQHEGIEKSRGVEAVVNAGDGGTEGGSDSDSDCCMLEGDPNKEEDGGGGGGEEEDDGEILVTGGKGPVACRDFPHARHNCATHPFGKSVHQTHCPMCHCFVCDVVAPCESWGDHCHASDADKKWNADRAQRKRKEKLLSLGAPPAPPPDSQIERLFQAHMQQALMKLVSRGGGGENKFAMPEMRGGEGAIGTRAPVVEPSWSWPAGGGVGRPEAGPHRGFCWNRVGTSGGSGGGGAPEHLQPCPVGAGGSQQWVNAVREAVGDSSSSVAPAPPPLPHWVEVNGMNGQIPVQEPVPQPPPPPQPEPYDPFFFQPPFPLASAPLYDTPINSYQSWQPPPPPSPSLDSLSVQLRLGVTPPPPSHHSHPQAYAPPPPQPRPLSRNLLPMGQGADVGGSGGSGVASESASLAASNGYGNVAFWQQHASLSKGGGGAEPGWQIEGGQWQPRRTWGAGGARWGGT